MKIALGTVQFGMDYGIANRTGQVPKSAIASILARARAASIDTLDTAIAYGDSETRLGECGVREFRVFTKLPKLDDASDVRRQVLDSIERLGIERLAGVFLHRSGDLGDADPSDADRLFSTLLELKTQGIAGKIGVSVYDPSELDAVFHRFPLDVVQAPYNVLDRRIETSGWLGRLSRAGVEVHCRSAFLQGLLLMKSEVRPPHFHQWGGLLAVWDEWLAESGQSALSAALGFACANPLVDRVVVGVDGAAQLDEILDAMDVSYSAPPPGLFTNDPELINPARWKLS